MLEFGTRIKRMGLAVLAGITLLLSACAGTQAPSATTPAASHAPFIAASTKLSIQGTPPPTAAVGSRYSFKPTVSVSDTGLIFSIQGQASWMTFDVTTGAVTGMPSRSDEGQTPSITISVSDGAERASIGPFPISVEATGSGSAILSWSAPTSNEDGTPIVGLTGYRVYYGTDPSIFSNAVEIAGASKTTYDVTGLSAGTYYFAVTAYNADGIESPMSNIGNKTI